MPVPQHFPVDLADAAVETRPALGWTIIALGTAALLLAVTNAVSIDSWGADLPPSAAVAHLSDEAARWRAATETAGLAAPRAAMRRLWTELEGARWPGQPDAHGGDG